MKEIEFVIEPNCHVTGFFDEYDDSFDHEFGTQVDKGWELTEAVVLVYIDDSEYDITESIKGKRREAFAERIIAEAEKQIEGPIRNSWF